MVTYTRDEKSIFVGVALAAVMIATGMWQFWTAYSQINLEGFIWCLVTGCTLTISGICGLCSFLTIYYMYEARL